MKEVTWIQFVLTILRMVSCHSLPPKLKLQQHQVRVTGNTSGDRDDYTSGHYPGSHMFPRNVFMAWKAETKC
ncbi:hypothetical protein LEMLEM_LOCUS25856 [Lemmus lemmus]